MKGYIMSRILLLEDDGVLSKMVQTVLQDGGFDVIIAKDDKEAYKRASNEQFNLYLLDVNTPYVEGFDLVTKLREKHDATPAFFITALNDLGALSKSYDTGIDDYIKKPFEAKDLLVRANAMIDRAFDFLDYGKLKFDALNKKVIKNGKEIVLTHVEKHIFDLLIRNLEQDITKKQFFNAMERPSEMALRVHINKIKAKLNIAIKNVRGVGYRLEKI
jgi:DNA-binding response OmpR family regulator